MVRSTGACEVPEVEQSVNVGLQYRQSHYHCLHCPAAGTTGRLHPASCRCVGFPSAEFPTSPLDEVPTVPTSAPANVHVIFVYNNNNNNNNMVALYRLQNIVCFQVIY